MQADVEDGNRTVEYAKVAVIDKLAEYGVPLAKTCVDTRMLFF